MTNKFVSEEIEHQIINLWLHGEKRDEIAVKTYISEGKVSNIIAKFQASLKAAGWSDDLIPYARETMKKMKGKGIGFNEIASALRVSAIIEKYGISDEALPFIQLLADAAKKENIDPSLLGKLLVAATDLFAAERNGEGKNTGFFTPSDLLKRIRDLAEKNKLLKVEYSSYTAKIRKINDDFAQLETRIKSRESEFRKFNDASQRLAKHGISIEDVDKFSTIMSNAKEHGMHLKSMIETLSEMRSARQQLSSCNLALDQTKQRLRDAENAHKKIVIESQDVDVEVKSAKRLRAVGLDVPKMESLVETIRKIAAKNGIPAQKAVEKFFGDLTKYDEKLGFEISFKNLSALVDESQRKLDLLKANYGADYSAITRLKILETHGIEVDQVLLIYSVISKSIAMDGGSNPSANKDNRFQQLVHDIEEWGSLRAGNSRLSEYIAKLEIYHLELGAEVVTLTKEANRIRNETEILYQSYRTQVEKLTNIFTNATTDAAKSVRSKSDEVVESLSKISQPANEILSIIGKQRNRLELQEGENSRTLASLKPLRPLAQRRNGELVPYRQLVESLLYAVKIVLHDKRIPIDLQSTLDLLTSDIEKSLILLPTEKKKPASGLTQISGPNKISMDDA